MEELASLMNAYGVSFVIVLIFLWDYIANKRKTLENQDMIKSTISTVEKTTVAISNCLKEIQQSNLNTAKSLELLQRQMENTEKKVDMVLEKDIINEKNR